MFFFNVIKRLIDLVGSSVLLILLFPLFLILIVVIKLESPGPAFFIQGRLGKNCHVFRMYKFRTMVNDAEKQGTGLFSYENDPRVTKIGGILRKTSLDELPQLINIFLGEMSLVGPRPPVTYELGPVEEFSEELNYRFQVKPGITGLAQISGRNDLVWPEKIVYDTKYVNMYKKYGVIIDFYILLKTVYIVLRMSSVIEKEKTL